MNTLVPTQIQKSLTKNSGSDEVRALVAELRAGLQYGRGEHTLHRAVTQDERAVLKERYRDLHSELRTVSYSDANKGAAGSAIAEMFTCLNFKPNPKVMEESIGWHVKQLGDLPLFAVQRACHNIGQGLVEGLNPDFRPTIPRIAQIARSFADPVLGEYSNIKLILAVTTVRESEEVCMERSARVGEGLRQLHATMAEMAAREDRERSEALAAKAIARNKEEVLREHVALGVKPIYVKADGRTPMPVSIALRKNIAKYQERENSEHFRDAKKDNARDQGS